jgi:hypothetical protein
LLLVVDRIQDYASALVDGRRTEKHYQMVVRQYNIFRGRRDKLLWVEAVDGLGAANAKMKALAEQTPGSYFVFCQRAHAVLASIDTSISFRASNRRLV